MRYLCLMFILVLGTKMVFAQSVSASSAGAIFPRELESFQRIKRRLYAMCPPQFRRIGDQCYLLSTDKSNWLEAHFYCKDKNSKLAEPSPRSDRHLKKFLQHHDIHLDIGVIWLGATYDWHNNVWQWSISGKNLTYNPFNEMDPGNDKLLDNHCAVYDPEISYGWSARSCPDRHRFICEHKMPKVSEQNRLKVYSRWNQTYPNEFANEVLLNVHEGRRLSRRGKAVEDNNRQHYPRKYNSQDVYATVRSHHPSENDIDYQRDHITEASNNSKHFAQLSTIFNNEIDGKKLLRPSTQPPEQMQPHPKRKPIRKRIKADLKFEHQREKERKRQEKLLEKQRRQQERERKQLERKQKKEDRQRRLREENERIQQHRQNNEVQQNIETHTSSKIIPETHVIQDQSHKFEDLKRIEQERETNLREIEKQKRLTDEKNRILFEIQERERQEETKRQQQTEEKRLAEERAQHARKLEEEEKARLLDESLKRAEKEKERTELINKRNKEAENQQAEEIHMLEEMKRLESERKKEHEQKIREEEEMNQRKELEARKKEEQEALERRQRLEKRARAEKVRKMAERISRLSPEAQRQFLEMRKKRKSKKNQQNTHNLSVRSSS